MLWAAVCTAVAAIQIGPSLVTESFEVSFADPALQDFEATDKWTLHSWVSTYQQSPSCMQAWVVTTPQGSLRLCKQVTGGFLGCTGAACALANGVSEQFRWEFTSVSVDSDQLKVCSSLWTPRSLSCVAVSITPLTLGSASTVQVSAEVEQYDLHLKTDPELPSLLSTYSCHSVCVSCFGPSFTSCEEFFPLVNLQTTKRLSLGQSQSFTSGDRVFRGKTYDSLSGYAVTAWFMIETSNPSVEWCEVLRFTKSTNEFCSNSRVPLLLYNQHISYVWIPVEQETTAYCEKGGGAYNTEFGAPSSIVGLWVYVAVQITVPQRYSVARFSSSSPYIINSNYQATQPRQWTTSGENHIILGNLQFSYFNCSPTFKFKDVRVYTDLSQVSLPAAPFTQLKSLCLSNCLACSDAEVCSSCESGFYLEGGLCKGCNASCTTCNGAGPYACLTCSAPLIHTQEGSCSRTCPLGSFVEDAQCRLCPSRCKSCVNSLECILCKEDLYELKQEGSLSCLQECPGGYFADQTSCIGCSSACKTCSGPSAEECLECADAYALIDGKCAQCPVDTHFDGLVCLACESSCKTCSSPGGCDSCPQDKTLSSEGLCISIPCPTGSYQGDTGCEECPPQCESCTSQSSCSGCTAGGQLKNGECACESVYVLEDICRVPFQVKTDENSVMLLTFNTPLKPGLTLHDIVLQSAIPISYNLRETDSASSFYVNFQFSSTPTSSVSLGVSVNSNLTDLYDVPVSKETLQVELSFSNATSSPTTPAAQSGSKITSSALVGGAALVGMMIGNPQSMLLLTSMLQFASLIPLMQFNISEELSSLLIGNSPFDSVPSLSTFVLKPDTFSEAYSKAKHYGFDSAGFLYNIGQELSVLVCLLLALLGLFIGSKLACCSSFQSYCSKKCKGLSAFLIPGFLQGCFQEMLVAAMIQLRSQEYHSLLNAFSCCCAWAFLVFGCVGSLLLVDAALRSKLNRFFLGLSSSPLERLRVPAFYVHRLVCVLVITLSYNSLLQGYVCLVLSLLVNSSQKSLLILAGMLRLQQMNWSTLLLEASDWVSMVVLLIYAYEPSIESCLKMVNIFYGINYALLAVSLVTSFYQLVVFCRKPRIILD